MPRATRAVRWKDEKKRGLAIGIWFWLIASYGTSRLALPSFVAFFLCVPVMGRKRGVFISALRLISKSKDITGLLLRLNKVEGEQMHMSLSLGPIRERGRGRVGR